MKHRASFEAFERIVNLNEVASMKIVIIPISNFFTLRI